MRHWWQLAIRNWRARPGRTALATVAIALGVGVVVWVTGAYESIRQSVADQVWSWLGRSHLSVESVYGQYGTVFESIADDVRRLPNVACATGRLKERLDVVLPQREPGGETEPSSASLDVVGIQPQYEYAFRDYANDLVAGRLLEPGDRRVIVLENGFAGEHGIRLGDTIGLRTDVFTSGTAFEVVGLLRRRRIARFQPPMALVTLPDLQQLVNRPGPPRVTQVNIILRDASTAALRRTAPQVRQIVNRYAQNFVTRDAEAKFRQVEAAQQQTEFILVLISSVALFTAFFIILSTLSMGMVERVGQLGLLRCIGMTRGQIFTLVLGETVPIATVGIALGVPVGIGLTLLTVQIVPEYVGHLALSRWGIALALAGGAATALAGGILPAIQATRVSPLEAARPQARATRPAVDVLAAVVGAAMIAGHAAMIAWIPPYQWLTRPSIALSGAMLLYCGCALLAPALIRFGGGVFVRAAACALGIRSRLLRDQIGRASWRSAGICSGLMVGLSLIVCLVVHTESLTAGWDFPKRMCEAFVWTGRPITLQAAENAIHTDDRTVLPGVGRYTLANDIQCNVGWFVAGRPREFFSMARLEFVAGSQEEAIDRLERGGCILITPEFAEIRNVGLGGRVAIQAGSRTAVFEVAGIVESPALDIAATYFNAESHLMGARVNGVLGTLEDAKRRLGIEPAITLFLINFDLKPSPPPRLFHQDSLPPMTRPADLIRWLDDFKPVMPERADDLDRILSTWAGLPEKAVAHVATTGPWLKGLLSSLGREPVHTERSKQTSWSRLPPDLRVLGAFRNALLGLEDAWPDRTPDERWRAFREETVLRIIADRSGADWPIWKSVAELKAEIDRTMRTATILMTAVPTVALIVAALGVANLMMANVASRTRQLAILRAVGATKSQITRLVIGEAIVLGAIGSLLGLALGTGAAHTVNTLTHRIWGLPMRFAMPWDLVGGAIALTVGVCLLAGVLPARRAARSNVVGALQVG